MFFFLVQNQNKALEVCKYNPRGSTISLYDFNARNNTKNLLLGPQEFSKNMRRKQILIGLFAVIIYRTIEEPKKLQGGWERAYSAVGDERGSH